MDKDAYRQAYNKYVVPFAENKPRIVVQDDAIRKIKTLAIDIVKAKITEDHHKIDSGKELKRFYTGLLGEAAMESLLGIDIIDYSVGHSNNFNGADICNHNIKVGIKTVEVWKFPIIHKNVSRPELINIRRDDKTIVFFGYATKRVLREFQNDDYILSSNLRRRGTKSAFWGFSELIPINSFDHLCEVYYKYDK